MTENTNIAPSNALFDRIGQTVTERNVDIHQSLSGNTLRLEFADGQRIVINHDASTGKVWMASRSGGMEFNSQNGIWRTHDHSELFNKLSDLIEQVIASDSLNAKAPEKHTTPTTRVAAPVAYEPKESHGLRNMLFFMLALLLGFWVAQRSNRQADISDNVESARTRVVELAAAGAVHRCESSMPANGSATLFPDSNLRTDGPNDPEIILKNDHAHPLLLILTAPKTVIPSISILIHARQSTTLHLPAGQYDIMFAVGETWCDSRSGFSDGHIVKLDKSLTVQMDKPMQLSMQSSGAGLEDFQLFVKTTAPDTPLPLPTFTGDGSMEVQRQANGHFYLPGTVADVPVTFMVDTGASVTSISSDIARQAGIRNCKEVQFQTANGPATGCIALVPNMTLGNFVVKNITVAVMPNMETNLLGANVLRNFQVSQNDSMMLIGRR